MTTPHPEARMHSPLVINLLSGPGAGKSTLAAQIFSELKRRGSRWTVELAVEFAKELVWEGRLEALGNQIFVLGEQFQRIERVAGKAHIVVTDSPVLLSGVYKPPHYPDSITDLALWCHRRFPSLNVYVERPSNYDPAGRLQTADEACRVDDRILDFVDTHDIRPLIRARSEPADAARIAEQALEMIAGLESQGRDWLDRDLAEKARERAARAA